ncbi:hypothetical protein [Pedobacter soli]|uniref:Uncharacterized protein n=1 Tax=Pedobacter soli TaxID=390242 RepID=A0A1G6XET3_9SPHI|nr:hypothetical protein [Pedobacter soli]SDD75736.1 hypothetical protein SAMN04488024_107299 [Pedobacter soli]
MSKDNQSPLDGFLEILIQQHEKSAENINTALYDDIVNTAEILKKTEDDAVRTEAVASLRNRFKNEDLNQVTDIFIYCQRFLSENDDPLPMASQLCISIGKLFTNENLHYAVGKVYSRDETESGAALSFLGYLALIEQHTFYVLNFIKENFAGFSPNNKTTCVFQLKEILPDNEIAKQIVVNSGITRYELSFSTDIDSSSKPITFQTGKVDGSFNAGMEELKPKRPWWKFW